MKSAGKKVELWCFEKAIKLDQENPIAWLNKGIALDTMGNHLGAIQCYNEAIHLDPTESEAVKRRVEARKLLGDSPQVNSETRPEIRAKIESVLNERPLEYLLRNDIMDLSEGDIFIVVGIISVLGFLAVLTFFIIELVIGLGFNIRLLISSVISLITAIAWFSIRTKYKQTASLINDIINFIKGELKEK